MAKVSFNSLNGQGVDMTQIGAISVWDLLDYDYRGEANSTTLRLFDSPYDYMLAKGTGLSFGYDAGYLTSVNSGTFTSVTFVFGGIKIVDLTEGNITAKSINAALSAGTSSAFFAALLSGNDRMSGTGLGDDLYGYNGNDIMSGNAGSDSLRGGAGSDTLYGGLGNDKLYGGDGFDHFVFDTKLGATNVDTIYAFSAKDDTIDLDKTIFTKLGKTGAELASTAFYANMTGLAHSASDRIIYEKDTGKLFYDADGTGSIAGVHFATLDKKPVIDYHDFLVIA